MAPDLTDQILAEIRTTHAASDVCAAIRTRPLESGPMLVALIERVIDRRVSMRIDAAEASRIGEPMPMYCTARSPWDSHCVSGFGHVGHLHRDADRRVWYGESVREPAFGAKPASAPEPEPTSTLTDDDLLVIAYNAPGVQSASTIGQFRAIADAAVRRFVEENGP
jgi:hypothetical protein